MANSVARNKSLASKGRYGDTLVAHISRRQGEYLKRMGGSGTINPETGLPEYFLGKLLKKIAPMAANFIPGIGPIAGQAIKMGIGAGVNALTNKKKKGQASQASAGEADNLAFSSELARRQGQLGDEAGAAMTTAYKGLMDDPDFGSFGRFSKSGYQGAVGDFDASRATERESLRRGKSANLNDMYASTTRDGMSGMPVNHRYDVGGYESDGAWDDLTSNSRDFADLGMTRANTFSGSASYDPSRWNDFIDGSTRSYQGELDAQTAQTLEDATIDANAQAESRGLGNSTYEVALRQAAGAGAARERSKNYLQANEMALAGAKARQALGAGDYEIGASSDRDAFGRLMSGSDLAMKGSELASRMRGADYDLESRGIKDSYDYAGADQRLRFGEQDQFAQNRDLGQRYRFNDEDQFFRNRGSARDDYYRDQTMLPDDYNDGMRSAFSKFASMGDARRGVFDETRGYVGDPYKIRGDFYRNASSSVPNEAYGNYAKRSGEAASAGAKGVGSMFDDFWEKGKVGSSIGKLFSSKNDREVDRWANYRSPSGGSDDWSQYNSNSFR